MLITVCIPSIRPTTLGAAIASLRRQRHEEWELVVVSQGDARAAAQAVDAAAGGDPRIRMVHIERVGTSVARNRGIAEARGDVVAFMDDDCEAADDWLEGIAALFDRYPRVGLVAGALVRPAQGDRRLAVCPDMRPLDVLYDPKEQDEAPDGFGAAGANLAVRRDVLEAVGPFDELLGPGAWFASTEDTDYILRAEAYGTSMYATSSVVMHHTHGYRYGLRAVHRLLRSYAVGNGALAAKLTLAGDPRGRSLLRREVRVAVIEPIVELRPHRLPRRLVRLAYYARAYRSCLRRCRVRGDQLASAVLEPAR